MTVQFTDTGGFVAFLSHDEIESYFGGGTFLSRDGAIFLAKRILESYGGDRRDINAVDLYRTGKNAVMFVMLDKRRNCRVYRFDDLEPMIGAAHAAAAMGKGCASSALFHKKGKYYITISGADQGLGYILSEYAACRERAPLKDASPLIPGSALEMIRAYFAAVVV